MGQRVGAMEGEDGEETKEALAAGEGAEDVAEVGLGVVVVVWGG